MKDTRKGRPRNQDLVKAGAKLPAKGKPGPKPGNTAIMREYQARMLASPKSRKIIRKVQDVALEDGHPHQAACMKMVMDRVLPLSLFDPKKGGGGGVSVNISIGEAKGPAGIEIEHSEDAEYTEVPEDDDETTTP